MKRNYKRPTMKYEEFQPTEFITACGDENKIYKFVCDAPGGTLYYYPQSDENIDGNYTGTGSAVMLGSYTPCKEAHEASTTNPFYDGYITNWSLFGGTTTRNVIVWRGVDGDNGHATANLDMNSWETAKS